MLRYIFALTLISTSCLSDSLEECKDVYRSAEWEIAKEICEQATKSGNSEAMYYLANVYGRKNRIKENEVKRIAWYEKAAEAGSYKSQAVLALHYSFTKLNRVKAEYYYLMSVLHNEANEVAFNSAGRFYRIRNKDIEKDESLSDYEKETLLQERWADSFMWHKRAADIGDSYGQIIVGDLYKDGMGIEQSWSKALEWYNKAANQGDKHAFFRLGYLFLHGVKHKDKVIVQKDAGRAYGYLKYAAEKWGKYSHVDLGHFDAYISNPTKKLTWKQTYGKSHHNPKKDIQPLGNVISKQEIQDGERIYELVISGEPHL